MKNSEKRTWIIKIFKYLNVNLCGQFNGDTLGDLKS